MNITKITPAKHNYLQILTTIHDVPEYIFYRGILPDNRRPTVAIVGTRRPTSYGREVAHRLAYDLAAKGIVVVSGLALGIDAIVHSAALDAGGTTIAVLANSVDQIRPITNHTIGERILANDGAILSEYEPPTPGRNFQFLQRNRIVSGLSDAIIVIEAAARSGTLATVAFALGQGKDVFAVPGNITSPLSAGCNAIIKQGATPVTCAQDIIEIIAPELLQPQSVLPLGDTPLESHIISLLQSGLRGGDQIHQQTTASSAEFNQALTMLELNGTIRALGGNQWTLR